jgi:preprotein translocase subunit SecE
MIFGKKGMEMSVGKLIQVLIVVLVVFVIFYFLNQVSEAGSTFLGMFD